MSDLEAHIRNVLVRYLAREVSADELSRRLPDGWDLDEANDPDADDLALLAMGYLAGYHGGDRNEDELRRALRQLISDRFEFEYQPHADGMITVLASRVANRVEVAFRGDTSPAEGFELEPSQHPRTKHRTTTALLDPPGSR